MRIAILKLGWMEPGGIPRVIQSWAGILSQAGHEVTVISQAPPGGRPFTTDAAVEDVFYPAPPAASRWTNLPRAARGALGALRELQRKGPSDVVLLHDSLLGAAVRRAFPDLPILLTFHSPDVDEMRVNDWIYSTSRARKLAYPVAVSASWLVERLALQSITAAHTLSHYTWSLLRARYPRICAQVPWRCIPGSYDDARFVEAGDRAALRAALGFGPAERVMLTVRRLVPRNGVDRILDCALATRDRPEVRFLIGGTGPLEAELRARIAALGLGSRVRMLGFVSEEDLPRTYQAADAFLLPTRHLECFGLPVIEAMACGAAPLVMPDGGPAEVLEPFPECIAAENSTQAFSELVSRHLALDRAPERSRLARSARSRYSAASLGPAIETWVSDLGRHDSPQ